MPAVTLPRDYWGSVERRVVDLSDFLGSAKTVALYRAAEGARFAWRGMADFRWPLHSSLAREYLRRHKAYPDEPHLRSFETDVLNEARAWNLDWHESGGRLSALELMAALQHFQVPTRLIDFTFNPAIALWFAVQGDERTDGRVIAIDVAGRLIDPQRAAKPDPWWFDVPPLAVTEWTTKAWVWSPPPLEARIVRQDACFLMGGIPTTRPERSLKDGGRWRRMVVSEVRASMSIPFQLIKYERAEAAAAGKQTQGAPAQVSAFTIRVGNKVAVRAELEQTFGYSHRSLFPDYPGFRDFAKSWRGGM